MVGRILREHAEIVLEALLDLFRIIFHCRGMLRCVPSFYAEHDIGHSPQISPPLAVCGCKAPDGLANLQIADWYRKLAPTVSTGKGNQHQTSARNEVHRRSEQQPHNWVDNCKQWLGNLHG